MLVVLVAILVTSVWAVPSLVFLNSAWDSFGKKVLLELLWIVLVYSDSLQLLVGRRWGRHKAFAKVSPNKTMEGYLGGLTLGLILGVGIHNWPVLPLVIVLIGGVVGDLAFSLVKRYAGIKDYSTLLGAHGGICDRIDSYVGACHFLFWSSWLFPDEIKFALLKARGVQ